MYERDVSYTSNAHEHRYRRQAYAAGYAATGAKTKRATVEAALRAIIQLNDQAQIRQLRGKVHWEGDLEAMRLNRFQ